jgi:AmmeMemoRadiSam system protein A
MPLSQPDGKELIKLARASVNSYFNRSELKISDVIKKKFGAKQGVFVTLTIDTELRGCIGYPEPVLPLYEAIVESAHSAAFSDPRFAPLSKEEFDSVHIELSVLTVPELIKVKRPEEYLSRIKIGSDGLIMRGDYGSGLLLPQVFTEYKCNPKKALEMTCQKAGLNSDAWKDLNNKIFKFQADIIEE